MSSGFSTTQRCVQRHAAWDDHIMIRICSIPAMWLISGPNTPFLLVACNPHVLAVAVYGKPVACRGVSGRIWVQTKPPKYWKNMLTIVFVFLERVWKVCVGALHGLVHSVHMCRQATHRQMMY